MPQEEWLVRSHWPDKKITEAVYSTREAAELESYFRQRYSGCKVEPLLRRTVMDWEIA